MQEIIDVLHRSIKNNNRTDYELVPTKTYKLGDIIQFPGVDHVCYVMVESEGNGEHYFCCISGGRLTGKLYSTGSIHRDHVKYDVFRFADDICRMNPQKIVGNMLIKGE